MKRLLLAFALLAGAVSVTWAQLPTSSGIIRVAIVERTAIAELQGSQIEVTELAGCPACRQDVPQAELIRTAFRRRTDLVRAIPSGQGIEVNGRRAAAFRLASDRPLRWNGREYPAPIELVRNGDGLALINEVPLEEYLVGVLRAESDQRWPLEALRAQAIASRTYAAYHRLLGAGKPYHIIASTAHQQYVGRVAPASPLWLAVGETTGQVLRWEGELFPAFYHTESGGFTEDPRTVFAARNMPALAPVRCVFSTNSPHYSWNVEIKLTDLAELLQRHDLGVGAVTAIDVTERTASLRAMWVTVQGTRGNRGLRGNDLRRIIGYDVLKSTLFAVVADGDVARFEGRGYGHGVGLCQWGAKGMAEQGYAARQILEFFYPGTTLGFLSTRS
jgi:stage II sporulation protein D